MLRRAVCLGSLLVFVALPLLALGVSRAADKDPVVFEMFQDKEKEFRWRLKQGDDIIGTSGQGYTAKASCTKGIEGIKKGLENGKDTFEIYEDNAKAFRWRLKASNGQTVASANKGFKTKAECDKVVTLIKKEAPKAAVVEEKK
jgi:uncharacterized protein YegP (UPF0339 family)